MLYFFIVHQKLSRPPKKIQTTHMGVATPRRKTIALDTNRTEAKGLSFYYPRPAVLPGSDAGSNGVEPASSFVMQTRQTSCSMWQSCKRA